MNLRGREVYIITGVIVVVVVVAWFFLLFRPLQNKVSTAGAQLAQVTADLSNARTVELPRLRAYQKTAPQTQSDLLRLNKMMPGEQGIPSVIVEITQTAQQSGLDFLGIQPGAAVSGNPFGVETINLSLSGSYYDLEDFLFRMEGYVQYQNNNFLVTGRLLQVASVHLTAGSSSDPTALALSIAVNAFLWTAPQTYSGSAPFPSAAATTSPSPAPSTSGTPAPTASPTPTGSTSP
jgi:Tfp pilus assembly protein PilO